MRVFVLTLAYAPAAVLKAGIERLYETATSSFHHVIVDQHYPFNRSDVMREVWRLGSVYEARVLDPGKNLGLHQGHNWALAQCKLQDDDIVILYDPDSWPLTNGWDQAIVDVMRADRGFDIVGLIDPRSRRELDERGIAWEGFVSGLYVQQPVRDGIISVAGYSGALLNRFGGFDEVLPYYGGLEAAMWGRLQAHGGKWCYLTNHDESLHLQELADPEFKAYKDAHAQTRTFAGTFEEWLAARA